VTGYQKEVGLCNRCIPCKSLKREGEREKEEKSIKTAQDERGSGKEVQVQSLKWNVIVKMC